MNDIQPTEQMRGDGEEEMLSEIGDNDVFNALEEVPARKHHCIQLAVKTLHRALDGL